MRNERKSLNILDARKKSGNKYLLEASLVRLREENEIELLEEGVADSLGSIIFTFLISALDDATGELGGAIALVPLLIKNSLELKSGNEKFKKAKEESASEEDIKKIVMKLKKDVADIISAALIALPIPALDGVAAGTIQIASSQIVSEFAKAVAKGGIISTALDYTLSSLKESLIIIYKFENPEDSSVQHTGEYDGTVDVTNPQETEETGLGYLRHSDQDLDLPFHPGDVTNFLSENNNYNISRWEKLAGIK